jgi:hypothetical protein
MRKMILLTAAAAMAVGMPALAKPGNGNGHGAHAAGKARVAAGGARVRTTHRVTALDRNGNGILDSRERRVAANRYGANDCPPGLARKNNGCLPPGQARRLFAQGQRIPTGYNFFSDYDDIPVAYRSRVPFSDASRYIYRDNIVYVVDPTTRLVTSIIDLIR